MKGEAIILERMAHVTNQHVNDFASRRVDENFKFAIRETQDDYVGTADTRAVTVEDVGADAKGRNPYVSVWFSGLVTFRLNTGWGEKTMKDWRISAKSLAELRAHARERGFKVAVKNTRGKKKRAAKRPKSVPKEQTELLL